MGDFEINLNNLKEKLQRNEVVFLVGAGISFDSGVPTVNQIYPELSRALNIDFDEFKRITYGYPFERVMQVLLRDDDIKNHFKKLFNQKKPSKIHYYLAHQIKNGSRNVMTTNFDQLIELAYKELYQHDLCTELPKNFVKKEFIERKSLIKLHGCISEDISELGVTINNVATKNNRDRIQSILEKVISSEVAILVMGYSGSDQFDIGPAMNDIAKSGCTLYYVRHSNFQQPELTTLAPQFSSFNGIEIRCNTSSFIDLVSQPIQTIVSNNPSKEWMIAFSDWKQEINKYKGLKESERLAQFYMERMEFDQAIQQYRFCQTILIDNNGFGYPTWLPLIQNQLAQALRSRFKKENNSKDIEEAFICAKSSLKYYNQLGEVIDLLKLVKQRISFRSMGSIVRDYTNAMGAYALTLRIMGRIPEAVEFYLQIIEICKYGDFKENICTTYSNLGFIYRENNPSKSRDYCLKAIELCDSYPENYKRCYIGLADSFKGLANQAFLSNKPYEAFEYLKEELDSIRNGVLWAKKLGQTYNTMNDRANEITQLMNLVKLKFRL